MALGQTHSLPIAYQFAVIIPWDRQAQRSIQQNLASSGFQQIGATNDFGNLHRGIVNYDRQLVRRDIIFSPDDEVAEIFAGHHSLRAQMQIFKIDFFAIGYAKTPVHSCRAASLRFGSTA